MWQDPGRWRFLRVSVLVAHNLSSSLQYTLVVFCRVRRFPSTKPGPTATWPSLRKSLWGKNSAFTNLNLIILSYSDSIRITVDFTDWRAFFLSQCVCHSHPVELPSHDAGVEECSLPGSWKHAGSQTCTGGFIVPSSCVLFHFFLLCVLLIIFDIYRSLHWRH